MKDNASIPSKTPSDSITPQHAEASTVESPTWKFDIQPPLVYAFLGKKSEVLHVFLFSGR